MMGVFGWDYPPGVTGNEPQIVGATCDCGDDCETVGTDCCGEQPRCETVAHLDTDGTVNVIVCRQGMGCDLRDGWR